MTEVICRGNVLANEFDLHDVSRACQFSSSYIEYRKLIFRKEIELHTGNFGIANG